MQLKVPFSLAHPQSVWLIRPSITKTDGNWCRKKHTKTAEKLYNVKLCAYKVIYLHSNRGQLYGVSSNRCARGDACVHTDLRLAWDISKRSRVWRSWSYYRWISSVVGALEVNSAFLLFIFAVFSRIMTYDFWKYGFMSPWFCKHPISLPHIFVFDEFE